MVGTVLESATALEGYFEGSDLTGTTFLECLNNACAAVEDEYSRILAVIAPNVRAFLVTTKDFTGTTCYIEYGW